MLSAECCMIYTSREVWGEQGGDCMNAMPEVGISLDGAKTIEKMCAEHTIHFSNGSRRSLRSLTPPVKFLLRKNLIGFADGSYHQSLIGADYQSPRVAELQEVPEVGVSLDGAKTIEKMCAEHTIHFSNGSRRSLRSLTPPVKFLRRCALQKPNRLRRWFLSTIPNWC